MKVKGKVPALIPGIGKAAPGPGCTLGGPADGSSPGAFAGAHGPSRRPGRAAALTELGFSPMLASTYVSVLGSTASSASRIFSTGMSSLALLVDSTSLSLRSLPRCRSSCTAETEAAHTPPTSAMAPRPPAPDAGPAAEIQLERQSRGASRRRRTETEGQEDGFRGSRGAQGPGPEQEDWSEEGSGGSREDGVDINPVPKNTQAASLPTLELGGLWLQNHSSGRPFPRAGPRESPAG